MSASNATTNVMMTLAALAATAAAERPSGESLAAHVQRITSGIAAQLANTALATAGNWNLVYVGLTASRANMAYIASNNSSTPQQFALCLRGTVSASPIDTSEDMNVGLMLPFIPGGTTLGNISQGAMEAFTDIIMGTGVLSTLKSLAPSELYVTGHSLGGALVTTVSLYLASVLPSCTIHPYTFAAPTAGDSTFASSFNSTFPGAVCVINNYDLVPNAWQTLSSLPKDHQSNPFYPGANTNPPGPGPTATPDNEIGVMIDAIAKNTNGNNYIQPHQQSALNSPSDGWLYTPYPKSVTAGLDQFEIQVGFQHANNTYLKLLGATQLPLVAPAVASISPTSGTTTGGTSVTITPPTGVTFSSDSVVDFGIVPAVSASVSINGATITAIAPPGVGVVDVRVTNMYGTSAAVPSVPNLSGNNYTDQFTFTAL